MAIDVRHRGCVLVLAASGDDPLRGPIQGLLDEGESLIILDLTRKPDLDSAVLGQLVACGEHARRQDAVIKLVVTAHQHELIVATELDRLFETFRNEEDALDSFLPWNATAGIP